VQSVLFTQERQIQTVDPASSIVLSKEDEENNSMPRMDRKFTRKEDGNVQSAVEEVSKRDREHTHY